MTNFILGTESKQGHLSLNDHAGLVILVLSLPAIIDLILPESENEAQVRRWYRGCSRNNHGIYIAQRTRSLHVLDGRPMSD